MTLGFAGAAAAQTKAADAEVGEVVVTATGTNISNVKPVGSQALSLGRDDILKTGRATLADVVRTLPQVQGVGFGELAVTQLYGAGQNANVRTNSGGNTSRGSQINLRGLPGGNSTLLLVDGHRLAPSGVQAAFQEANQVPFAAVERVEVIADGASAIYGSDAIAGVVNYVLRKKFDGAEASVRYGEGHYGGANWAVSGSAGHGWENLGRLGAGSIMISAERSHQDPIHRGKIGRLRDDLRPYGGNDNRITGASYNGTPAFGAAVAGSVANPGNPGNIVVRGVPGTINQTYPLATSNIYYGIPTVTGDAIPTAAQVLANLNNANFVDASDYDDIQPEVKRDQIFVFARQELTSNISAYYEGFYTKRNTRTRVFTSEFNNVVQINPGTKYYIPGLTGATNNPYLVQWQANSHYPGGGDPFVNITPEKIITHIAGLNVTLPNEWAAEASITYGRNEACGTCYFDSYISSASPSRAEYIINQGRINPYTTDKLTAEQRALIAGTNYQQAQNTFWDTVVKFNGPLFSLPAGQVKTAVGVEYTRTLSELQNAANRNCEQYILGVSCTIPDNIFRYDADTHTRRTQYSAFGELYIPVVSEANALPMVRELLISAAARYDHYDKFGSTTNPKLGVTWKPIDDLTVRSSWGTSFRAPGLPDTDPGAFSFGSQQLNIANRSGDPSIINDGANGGVPFTTSFTRTGGNPDVGPEKGQTFSVGFDYAPSFLHGLKISPTYFNVEYRDRVAGPATGTYLSVGGPALAYLKKYITPVPVQPGCVNTNPATYPQVLRDALAGDLYGPNTIGFLYGASSITNPCGIHVIVDQRVTNLALTKQDGLDLTVSYVRDTDLGMFNFATSFTTIFKNETTVAAGLPATNELDRINYPVSRRGRASVGWFKDSIGANLSVNYVGSFVNDQPFSLVTGTGTVRAAVARVPSWTTADLNLNYTFSEDGSSLLKGVRASVSINNVTNREPRTVLSANSAVASALHNPLGRTWTAQITKRF